MKAPKDYKTQIKDEESYHMVMEQIEHYLTKATQLGDGNKLSSEEKQKLRDLSLLAEAWEDNAEIMPIKEPQTIIEMLELKMFERKLKQKELAVILDISATRLSEVLRGKRKVNMDLAKRLYHKLDIDPAFILEKA